MSIVHGHIRVKETNKGIPGLTVSVRAEGTSGKDPKQAKKSPDPFEHYPVSLGSEITGTRGQFRLEFCLNSSDDAKVYTQPSLILTVSAPAAQEAVGQLQAPPPFKRLLYWTELPELGPAQTEACEIRLLEEQLDNFDIELPGGKIVFDPKLSAGRLVEKYAKSEEFRSEVLKGLAPLRKARVARGLEISKAAQEAAASFHATSLKVQSQGNFILSPEELETKKEEVMKDGLAKMEETEEQSIKVKHTSVTLNKNELTALGFDPDSFVLGEFINVPTYTLCQLLHERLGGMEITRVRDLLEARKEDEETPTPEETGPEEQPAEAEEESLSATQQRVLGQLKDMPLAAPSLAANLPQPLDKEELTGMLPTEQIGQPSYNAQRLTREELNAMLPGVQLGAGPSDVTSFHDFYNLQIAFPHIWTEAFDPDLRRDLKQLMEDALKLHDEYHGPEEEYSFELPVEESEVNDIPILLDEISGFVESATEQIPKEVREEFTDLTWDQWSVLSPDDRARLTEIAGEIQELSAEEAEPSWLQRQCADSIELRCAPMREKNPEQYERCVNDEMIFDHHCRQAARESEQASPNADEIEKRREEGQAIFSSADTSDTDKNETIAGRVRRLSEEIRTRLTTPYAFHYFAPDSVNYGLLLTYRQEWQPQQYQVGDLVATIPLAPGEKRKFVSKQVVKRTRAETELEKALSSKSREASVTKRADAEITEKASLSSNFQMTATGSLKLGRIAEIGSTTELGVERSQESARVKKDFREAVVKAAQEYKQERSVKVDTTDELTSETTTSGELSNPNNELSVTYLLYELERQYRISERIHRVTPVVLVAQDVPAPNEITESWLLTHDWILRRVLLDDGLLPALDYLSDAFAGEELSVAVKKANWEMQVSLVRDLEGTVTGFKTERDALRDELIGFAKDIGMEKLELKRDLSKFGRLGLFGFIKLIDATEQAAKVKVNIEELKVLRQEAEAQLAYAEEGLKEAQERLVTAEEALNQATRVYTDSLEQQTNRRVAIDQLRVHVKENILYYMQAIWDHEPPDQRFFRLYHVMVNLPESPTGNVRMMETPEGDPVITFAISPSEYAHLFEWASGLEGLSQDEEQKHYSIEMDLPTLPDQNAEPQRLVEIADLDHPLGYKGNYIIFPLKKCIYLTNYMMREFFDDYFGVRDPDLASNFSVDEILTYAQKLYEDGVVTPEDQPSWAALRAIVMSKLRQPQRDSDLVVVPTGELFMEALPGEHPLLEDFKLNHRFFDMAKARAEWREAELENLRKAARMLQAEPNLEDPEIDKRVLVEGASGIHVDVPE